MFANKIENALSKKFVVEVHVGKRYGGRVNTEESGDMKSITINGEKHHRISSQCKKFTIKKEFQKWIETVDSGDVTVNSRHLRTWIEKIVMQMEDLGDVYKNNAETISALVVNLILQAETSKDKNKRKTNNVITISRYDAEVMIKSVVAAYPDKEKMEDAKKLHEYMDKYGIKFSENTDELNDNKERKKAFEESVKKYINNHVAAYSLECAFFGRMITSMFLPSVESAICMNHSIAIGKAALDYDYFTVIDTLIDRGLIDSPNSSEGAGYLDVKDFGSNVFYEYTSIDLRQVIVNYMHGRNSENFDTYLETVLEALKVLIKYILLVPPVGAQHSFATSPDPIVVYITVRTHGSNRTAEKQVVECMYGNGTEEKKLKNALKKFIYESPFVSSDDYDRKIVVGDGDMITSHEKAEAFNIKDMNLSDAVNEIARYAREVYLNE